jgi:hypothetical protein
MDLRRSGFQVQIESGYSATWMPGLLFDFLAAC